MGCAKDAQVADVCATLSPVKGRSKVQTFEALDRQTPSPHTWGEVAIVQGRIVAGTWTPRERLWIKVQRKKELLGQAIFDNGLIKGHDKSDLPQTSVRPSIYDYAARNENLTGIEGELPADFVPPIDESAEFQEQKNDPRYSDQVRLLAGSHARDLAWEREKAIDRDKYRRMEEALYARLEMTFREATAS